MRLNELKPHPDSNPSRKRVGRGIGSGDGKTCGRGHKGQKSRSGGFHKVGFEGGQMPLQRRLPKVGFRSHMARITAEIRLNELELVEADVVTINSLQAANLISKSAKRAKVIASGEIKKAVTLKGIRVTVGARAAIEAAGGKIED
ncbi:MAG: large subunit ribosomal protein L15 [Gammaproteobacteria bacterium]|jgi:large subunit ribosomal protein L15